MHAYLLLDRSGSMASRWAEALSSVNAYVRDLAGHDATRDGRVTLAVFDGHAGLSFDILRGNVPVLGWADLSDRDATPRGMTPLFDAIGRLVALAEAAQPDRAVLIVMTDGAENDSREITKAGAKAAFDRARARGWQVVFLGADFDAMAQAESVGTQSAQMLNTVSGSYADATRILAARTARYASSAAPMAFTREDREQAAGRTAKPAS